MGKIKKDNRAKRKRGKKFVFQGDAKAAADREKEGAQKEKNPFEEHSTSKRAKRDAEAR